MIFEKHSVHLNRLESFYLMPFASYLPTQIISELKYYSYRNGQEVIEAFVEMLTQENQVLPEPRMLPTKPLQVA